MKLDFVKISPTENMTILVKTAVPTEQQLAVGAKLIEYSSVYAEQAGFIEEPINKNAVARLRMMAGEFCGNATMSLGAYIAFKNGLEIGNETDIPLEVSGAEGIRNCHIKAVDGGYIGTVSMPLPVSVKECTLNINDKEYYVTEIAFEGIKHYILPKNSIGEGFKAKLEGSLENLKNAIEDDVFGIVVFDEENMRIDPLVVVKSAGSVYWERGCGSGSEATGVYIAYKNRKSIECELNQPGGIITVDVEYDNGIKKAAITGKVKIAAEGTAYI